MPERFPKTHRLCKSREFLRVIRRGKFVESAALSLQILPKQAQTRLGITVTKKFGRAHRRNRFKRQLREIFRTSHSYLPAGLWIHVRPKPHRPDEFHQLKAQFLQLVRGDAVIS